MLKDKQEPLNLFPHQMTTPTDLRSPLYFDLTGGASSAAEDRHRSEGNQIFMIFSSAHQTAVSD